MRLVTYSSETGAVAGVLVGNTVCPLSEVSSRAGLEPLTSVRAFLAAGGLQHESRLTAAATELVASHDYPCLEELALLPPVTDPDKILCLALNSKAHCVEAGVPQPVVPWFFPKWRTSLVGHNGFINPPAVSQQLDWEGEIALVIGAVAKHVEEHEAHSYIAGVMPFNDISARDLIHGLETIVLTKAGDYQAPCGPALVTCDELVDINELSYRTRVNGVVKQDGDTGDQIFNAAQTIASLTRTTTLLPGDIVAMGTLVGAGAFSDPPQFLREGDTVEVEVDGVGTLRTWIGPPSIGPVSGPVAGVRTAPLAGDR